MTAALEFREVSRMFGRRRALDHLSFMVPRGSLTGLVGHNGAGKTTAFSIVGGYLKPDSGEVDILGHGPFDAIRLKGMVGLLPQDAELPDRHTPAELVKHLGRLQGLSSRSAQQEADRVLDIVLLRERATSLISTLSHGMRRRVAIATALVGNPPLILLDEPTAGLDPLQARAIREQLRELRGSSTLVVSSHDLADLERISDWIIMLESGRCLRQGALGEVTRRNRIVRWELGEGEVPLRSLRDVLPAHTFELDGRVLIQDAVDGELDRSSVTVMSVLVQANLAVRTVSRGTALEERFLEDLASVSGS